MTQFSDMVPAGLHAEMLARLVAATLLGSFIGYERERTGKPAGVKTHGMVGLGAALFTVVSLHGFGPASDVTRVAAQIVTGIGFIGAGAILHERGGVHGLTTAASLWVTAAVGLAVGVVTAAVGGDGPVGLPAAALRAAARA